MLFIGKHPSFPTDEYKEFYSVESYYRRVYVAIFLLRRKIGGTKSFLKYFEKQAIDFCSECLASMLCNMGQEVLPNVVGIF